MTTQFMAQSSRNAAHAMLSISALGLIASLHEITGRDLALQPWWVPMVIPLAVCTTAYAVGSQIRITYRLLATKTLNTQAGEQAFR